MTNSPNDAGRSNDWEPCRSGELRDLASRLRSSRRMGSNLLKLAAVVLIGAMIGTGVFLYQNRSPGGITCQQCSQYLASHGTSEAFHQLDADVRQSIVKHVADCPDCHEHFQHRLDKLIGRIQSGIAEMVAFAESLWR